MNKKGFISTSIIYSFFLVFILLMIALLMSFVNKRFLISKISDNQELDPDVLECTKGKSLRECLFKSEYIEYMNSEDGSNFKNINNTFDKISFNEASIKAAIDKKSTNSTTAPNLRNVETNEVGMYSTPDNYGTSYYYRGAENDNYVVFAGYVWRVIRVNGDSSIRMIYQGKYNASAGETKSKVTGVDYIVDEIGELSFNNSGGWGSLTGSSLDINDFDLSIKNIKNYKQEKDCKKDAILNINKCSTKIKNEQEKYTGSGNYLLYAVGYMNAKSASLTGIYNGKYANEISSTAKVAVEYWYNANLNKEEHIGYIDDKVFCGDKDRTCKYPNGNCIMKKLWEQEDGITDKYFYAAFGRIHDKNDKPTLICGNTGTLMNSYEGYKFEQNLPENVKTNLSRYTVNQSNEYNSDLSYPIGLISADELNFAGAVGSFADEDSMPDPEEYISNTAFYLYSPNKYWTMTLSYTDYYNTGSFGESLEKRGARYFAYDNGRIHDLNDEYNTAYIRPVINLKSDILYCDGSGTASDPYIIGNGSC